MPSSFYLTKKTIVPGLFYIFRSGVLVVLVGRGSLGWGRFEVRTRVKGKCVIVLSL